MANSSKEIQNSGFVFQNIKYFPPVEDGKINLVQFLEATSDLLSLVDRLGSVFAPVRYDMQGNIDKINKYYVYNEDSCLLELMLEEKSKGKHLAANGVLWLNRALLFFELLFQEILKYIQNNNIDVGMKHLFTSAYEGSVKKYHNWVTQQLFKLICKMSPSLLQILQSLEVTSIEEFEFKLTNYNMTLHVARCEIDNFFVVNNFFNEDTSQNNFNYNDINKFLMAKRAKVPRDVNWLPLPIPTTTPPRLLPKWY